MREAILIIMGLLAIVCFYKAGMCVDDRKQVGILLIAGLFLICLISLLINFTLIVQNDNLEEQNKGLPKYGKIDNVYILKK